MPSAVGHGLGEARGLEGGASVGGGVVEDHDLLGAGLPAHGDDGLHESGLVVVAILGRPAGEHVGLDHHFAALLDEEPHAAEEGDRGADVLVDGVAFDDGEVGAGYAGRRGRRLWSRWR